MSSDQDPLSQFFTKAELDSPSSSDILYTTLGIDKSASPDQVRKAYRQAALKWHPDKHAAKSEEEREEARGEFLKVGFAFEVLGDEGRRKTYDRTGSTASNSMSADAAAAGGWEAYFKGMWNEINKDVLDEHKKVYQGSKEELSDLHESYISSSGHLPTILEAIPHSSTIDEDRFITSINSGISDGSLPLLAKWKKSSEDSKARQGRKRKEGKEAKEAEASAREMGVWEEFYGDKSGKAGESSTTGASETGTSTTTPGKKRKSDSSTTNTNKKSKSASRDDDGDISALSSIIAKRQASREDQFDALLKKYSKGEDGDGGKKGGKGKKGKRDPDDDDDDEEDEDVDMDRKKASMPDDAEFEAFQAKLFADKSSKDTPQSRSTHGRQIPSTSNSTNATASSSKVKLDGKNNASGKEVKKKATNGKKGGSNVWPKGKKEEDVIRETADEIAQNLALDQSLTTATYPGCDPFTSFEDIVDRLLPWHVWQVHDEDLKGYYRKGKEREVRKEERAEETERVTGLVNRQMALEKRVRALNGKRVDVQDTILTTICGLTTLLPSLRSEHAHLQNTYRQLRAEADRFITIARNKEAEERRRVEEVARRERILAEEKRRLATGPSAGMASPSGSPAPSPRPPTKDAPPARSKPAEPAAPAGPVHVTIPPDLLAEAMKLQIYEPLNGPKFPPGKNPPAYIMMTVGTGAVMLSVDVPKLSKEQMAFLVKIVNGQRKPAVPPAA